MCDCILTGMNISSELSLRSLRIQYIGNSKRAQWVKALAKVDNLSSIPPESTRWRRELIHMNCPLASIYKPWHACAHLHIHRINKQQGSLLFPSFSSVWLIYRFTSWGTHNAASQYMSSHWTHTQYGMCRHITATTAQGQNTTTILTAACQILSSTSPTSIDRHIPFLTITDFWWFYYYWKIFGNSFMLNTYFIRFQCTHFNFYHPGFESIFPTLGVSLYFKYIFL